MFERDYKTIFGKNIYYSCLLAMDDLNYDVYYGACNNILDNTQKLEKLIEVIQENNRIVIEDLYERLIKEIGINETNNIVFNAMRKIKNAE